MERKGKSISFEGNYQKTSASLAGKMHAILECYYRDYISITADKGTGGNGDKGRLTPFFLFMPFLEGFYICFEVD
jgi:hypothetical protein